MARVKVSAADILARLAKGECANYRNNGCRGAAPCTVIAGEACDYFAQYVKPLLDYQEFSAKYGREAKVAVALNPKSKIIKKRRKAGEPTLAIDPAAKPSAKPLPTTPIKQESMKPARPAKPPVVKQAVVQREVAITTVVSLDGRVSTKPRGGAVKAREATQTHSSPNKKAPGTPTVHTPVTGGLELVLELTPSIIPHKKRAGRTVR